MSIVAFPRHPASVRDKDAREKHGAVRICPQRAFSHTPIRSSFLEKPVEGRRAAAFHRILPIEPSPLFCCGLRAESMAVLRCQKLGIRSANRALTAVKRMGRSQAGDLNDCHQT
jgi:hypothetical protein